MVFLGYNLKKVCVGFQLKYAEIRNSDFFSSTGNWDYGTPHVPPNIPQSASLKIISKPVANLSKR